MAIQILGIIAGILALIAPIPYIRDILKGTTKPNRATWFIWSALLVIALFSQLASGATWSVLLTAADLIGTGTTFILSIWHGKGGWNLVDKLSLLGAGLGLLLWYLFNNPALALGMTIFVDACGAMPTLYKSYHEPESETAITYWLVAIAGVLATIAVGKFSLVLMAYPIYLALINGTTGLLITYNHKFKAHKVKA